MSRVVSIRVLRMLLLLCMCVPLATAYAQSSPTAYTPAELLQRAERTLNDVERKLRRADAVQDLRELADSTLEVQRDADAAASALAPELALLEARLQQLGPVAEGRTEAPDIAAQRRELERQRASVDSAIKRSNLLALEARQLAESIERDRAQRLNEQLSLRTASPLSPGLWRGVAEEWPRDLARVRALYHTARASLLKAVAERGWSGVVAGVAIAVLVMFPLRLFLRWLGRRYAVSRGPASRLRRSGLASWFLVLGTVAPGLAVWIVFESLRGMGALPAQLDTAAQRAVALSFGAAFIGSLGASLLLPTQPSWRMFPIDDATALRLRKYVWMTAALIWTSGVALAITRAAAVGAAATSAGQALVALLHAVLIIAILSSLSRAYRARAQKEEPEADAAPASVPRRSRASVVPLVTALGQLVVVAAVIAALLGYINFALFATQQVIWTAAIVGAVTLLLMFADDFALWLFAPDSRVGRAACHALGMRPSRMDQAGVLLSAALRLGLLLLGLAALVAPFGSNLSGFLGWFDVAAHGVNIGKVRLEPATIARTLIVLAVGLGVVQAFQRWLVGTYLPRTELDAGLRNSISTVARYVGIFLAVAWALASMGLDLESLALVASALSVGIGFGLQAITQNFISGLILLAERPVKIGDWVRIGNDEGDIRRISVRSTEIQVGDKSTLIVPNSELITKTIRNMTLADPAGRIQIQFSVPLDSDVARVRQVLLEIYSSHAKVLEDPEPAVFIDSIIGNLVSINSFAYVSSPREVYGVRSDLLFDLLRRLREEGVDLVAPQEVRIVRGAGGGAPVPAPPPP